LNCQVRETAIDKVCGAERPFFPQLRMLLVIDNLIADFGSMDLPKNKRR
jgi:hypothetical protein